MTTTTQQGTPSVVRATPSALQPREVFKTCAHVTATVAIVPLLVTYWLQACVIGRDRALAGHSELLSLVPGLSGRYLRRGFLARVLAGCDRTASIEFGVLFSKAGASIGPRAYIGPRCHIGLVAIEADVLLAAGVHVTSGGQTHGHADLTRPIRDQQGTATLVRIGAGAWIGSAAVVMADVGEGSIVGAGAVVTKPVPAEVIAAGVPARVIRSRRESAS